MFLKNRNTISKIKRSKVTDYAALTSELVNFESDVHLGFASVNITVLGLQILMSNTLKMHQLHNALWLCQKVFDALHYFLDDIIT